MISRIISRMMSRIGAVIRYQFIIEQVRRLWFISAKSMLAIACHYLLSILWSDSIVGRISRLMIEENNGSKLSLFKYF